MSGVDQQTLVQGAVTIAVGAASGGITNAIAIWMLFHPYEPRGIGRLVIQGAIPKNKARLARTIGRTVGERLLTPEDLAERLGAPAVRQAFDQAMARLLADALDRDRGPLREQLGPDLARALDDAVAAAAPRIAARVAAYARSPEFERLVERWLERLRRDLGDRPLAAALTQDRRAEVAATVERWVGRLAEGDDLERTLRAFVTRRLQWLAQDEEPLLDRLPPGIVGALEQAITDYLPIALERLSAVLADPEARGTVQRALREAFDHAIRDLLLHERLLARLIVTDRAIEELVDGFEREGFERFAESLAEPRLKAQVAQAVNDAVVNFLRRSPAERIRRLTPERRDALDRTLGDWLVRVARDPATRGALARTVDRLIGAAERRTWGEVLSMVPPERLAGAVGEALAGEAGQRWIQDGVVEIVARLLARPIGRPAEWLGPETAAVMREGLSSAAWEWTQDQIPRVVEQIRVPETVEQKVLGFSTQRMEEIVRNVTQRELDLIVRLGYVLGGLVGLVAFLANLAIR